MRFKQFLQENVQLKNVDSLGELEGVSGIVDVTGEVNLAYMELVKLPVDFGKVGGDFNCYDNQLTSLKGCPSEVGGDFYCSNNHLTSLEGCPSEVGGKFNCGNNHLTSLEGCPSIVNGHFYCYNNQLTSLVGIHKLVKKINGIFDIEVNRIKEGGIGLLLIDGIKEVHSGHRAFDIINKYVSQGKMGILACQEELIENGYEEFTKL